MTRLTAVLLLAGCAPSEDGTPSAGEGDDFRDGSYFYVLGYDPDTGTQIKGGAHAVAGFDPTGKAEPIDAANAVLRFHPDFTTGSEYHVYDAALTQGETSWEVFPSTWWPQANNGTAWRWQPGSSQDYGNRSDVDRLSPLEKYDLMFHPGQEQEVEAVSHCRYADHIEDPDNCEEIEHPAVTVAGPATKWELENQGRYQWVEPDSWWGHCNGWASYATTEPLGYPRRDIRVRMDGDQVIECTDDAEGCVLWRMADMEALMTELYFSDQATFSGRRCNTRPDQIERDEHGRPTEVACRDLNPGSFHVAITGMFGRGARNLATGEEDGHPAFVIDHNWDHEVWNFPITGFEVNHQEDITEAQANALVGAAGSDYAFNANATRFVQVALTYAMISDGVPSSQLFVRADQRNIDPVEVELNYVLELGANDRILGGEWIQDPSVSWGPNNKELHPDFIWMATDHRGVGEGVDDLGGSNDNPFVAYSRAQALLACANDPQSCAADEPGDGDPILDLTAEATQGQMQTFDTGELEAGRYIVSLRHDPERPGGDADLYVRVGQAPTLTAYDCRPYLSGSVEQCIVELEAANTIFVHVRGYGSGVNAFGLRVERDGGSEQPVWDGMQESGTVAANAELRWNTPELAAGDYVFELSGTADADLYVRRGAAPTTTAWDCRPYQSGSSETCTVELASPTVIHVMVRGWAASSTFELSGRVQ